ncbi:hypothetical protein [Sphingorhabdus sp.]|uniref:hypothetical protein n=2 Tax=Sphingorhabdus sp. TaxID=1902408 RepID=UPI003BB18634|nr:hypothetical protein [Sphingomonadales bacterium]
MKPSAPVCPAGTTAGRSNDDRTLGLYGDNAILLLMSGRIYRTLLFASALGCAVPIYAQNVQHDDEAELDAVTEAPKPPPVKIEPAGAADLRDAIRRIAVRPNDSYALTDAGYASLKLGDANAAYNFFVKANGLQPSDARIKSGLAQALVRKENPFEALRYFDEALRLGASERSFALDRALAYDLLGNFDRASQDYQLARTYGTSDEIIVRHAISLSLNGQANEADEMLGPLLKRENAEAWRARSFMLAARGDPKEAGKIAAAFMPEAEVRRLDYYFRQMSRLTPAQQAAALHFGHFPTNGNIGRDSEEMRKIAAANPPKPVATSGSDRLIPSGTPLGTKTASKDTKQSGGKTKASKKDKEPPKTVAVRSDKTEQQPKDNQQPKQGRTPVQDVKTASAQAAIDKAKLAKRGVVVNTSLPPPDSARSTVPAVRRASTTPQPVLPTPATQSPVAPAVKIETVATPKPVAPSAGFESLESPKAEPASPLPVPAIEKPKPDIVAVASPPVSSPVLPSAQPALTKAADPVPGSAVTPIAGPDVVPPSSIPAQTAIATIAAQTPSSSVPQGPNVDGTTADTVIRPPAETATLPQVATVSPPAPVAQTISQPVPAPKAAETGPPKPFDLGAVVASIEIPVSEQQSKVIPVDIKKIKPQPTKADAATVAKADSAKDAKAKAALSKANAARHWVQIATGSDMNGLAFDYRRMAKKTPALFEGKEGWTASWGKSRRLLVGPFDDMKTAKKWEADFRKAGGDGFAWKSAEGEVIDKLKGK